MSHQLLTYRIEWNGIPITVRHIPKKWSVIDHIELESDDRRPFPGSETGYKSLYITPEDMQDYADGADFARQFLDFAAAEGDWQGVQFTLF